MAADLTRHPSARRFRAVAFVLGVLGLLAVTVAIGAASSDRTSTASSGEWASWSPSATGTAALQQIADHVAPKYRGADGGQLVSATGGPLAIAGLPARIAVRSASTGNITIVQGTSVLYTLCGLGPHCSIPVGKPSTQRMLLLRREALELALYTFKSQPDVENVVVLMPPRPGQQEVRTQAGQTVVTGNKGAAVLFQRSRLGEQLSSPLDRTVTGRTPTIATVTGSPNVGLVNRLTGPNLFLVSIVEGQDASAYLVLDPIGS